MKIIVWVTMLAFGFFSPMSLQAESFGKATVQEGRMILVRGGKELTFPTSKKTLPIEKGDLIRVGNQSQVLLTTQEGTEVTLGANALFQVKAWRQGQHKGYLKMVYGKAQINQKKVRVGKRKFRMRTVNTVVGVRGTGWFQQTTADGNTLAATKNGTIEVNGLQGEGQEVKAGKSALTIAGKPATASFETPKELIADFSKDLGASHVNLPDAKQLWDETRFLEMGVINQSDLLFSKIEQVRLADGMEGSPNIQPYDPEKNQEPDEVFDKDFEQSRPEETQELDIKVDFRPTAQLEITEPEVAPDLGGLTGVKAGFIHILFEN